MTASSWLQIIIYLGALTALAIPMGAFIAKVFDNSTAIGRTAHMFENRLFRLLRVDGEAEMGWRDYASAMLLFNFAGFVAVYLIQRFQDHLPFNPVGLGSVSADSSFNTAVSFASNTNWQGYGGETTMSYFTQMIALTVQNFVSAATGIAILIALSRGFSKKSSFTIGNFWSDLTRSTVFVLLPLSCVLAVLLVSQGVVQTLSPHVSAAFPQIVTDSSGQAVTEQLIAVGPAASQIAIKQLGTNGGGFFNVNSSHPFENPTPLSNFLEMLAILLIPAALCHTFGKVVGDRRQGWALYAVMFIVFTALMVPCAYFESKGNPLYSQLGVDDTVQTLSAGGNMEGKEIRFGPVNSAIWAAATTAASNGSVNSMHDSYTPLGGLVPIVLMQFGEVIFGGVGSGLYGLLAFAIVAVFIAGLMVGRTPEYLGKKISAYEMKLVSLVVLIPCVLVLVGTAVGIAMPGASASITNPGPHGFSQVLYAYSSMGNNNGSAFAGFGANVPLHNLLGGIIMWISRYWIAIPVLALAGSLAQKVSVPASPGTLQTHTPLFVALLIGVVIIVGVLTFLPALALGPIVEHLRMTQG